MLDQSNEGRQYSLRYTLRRNDGSAVSEADKPSVTWLDGNNVAGQNVGNSFVVGSDGVGNGELTVVLREMGGSENSKGRCWSKGLLQRKIKIILIKTQSFRPAWVASQVFGTPSAGESGGTYGEHVTLMFTVPETCPAELFPLRVLIGVEDLDVRAAAGMSLPVIRRGEDGFGENILDEKGSRSNTSSSIRPYSRACSGCISARSCRRAVPERRPRFRSKPDTSPRRRRR